MAITIHNVSLLHYYDKRRCHNGLKKWTMVEKSGDEPFLSWSDMTTHQATTKYHHVRKNEKGSNPKLFGCLSAFFAIVEWRCRFANFLLQWVFRILGPPGFCNCRFLRFCFCWQFFKLSQDRAYWNQAKNYPVAKTIFSEICERSERAWKNMLLLPYIHTLYASIVARFACVDEMSKSDRYFFDPSKLSAFARPISQIVDKSLSSPCNSHFHTFEATFEQIRTQTKQ